MPSDYAKTLGARLRAIRTQQGLSLHGVEEKSRGRWKAVVVGSYERGDRSVTVQKLAELAEFYGVPVSELLPGDVLPTLLAPSPKLVIDLERMAQLPKDKAGPLARYVATIQSQRGDYNGRVLSIRQEDLRSLAVIYDKTPTDLTEELISWGILDADARGAIGTFCAGRHAAPCAGPGRGGLLSGRQQRQQRLSRHPQRVLGQRQERLRIAEQLVGLLPGHGAGQASFGCRALGRAGGEERGPLGQRRLDLRQQFPHAQRLPAPR